MLDLSHALNFSDPRMPQPILGRWRSIATCRLPLRCARVPATSTSRLRAARWAKSASFLNCCPSRPSPTSRRRKCQPPGSIAASFRSSPSTSMLGCRLTRATWTRCRRSWTTALGRTTSIGGCWLHSSLKTWPCHRLRPRRDCVGPHESLRLRAIKQAQSRRAHDRSAFRAPGVRSRPPPAVVAAPTPD